MKKVSEKDLKEILQTWKNVTECVEDCFAMIISYMEQYPPNERYLFQMRVVNSLFNTTFRPAMEFKEQRINHIENLTRQSK